MHLSYSQRLANAIYISTCPGSSNMYDAEKTCLRAALVLYCPQMTTPVYRVSVMHGTAAMYYYYTL